MPKKCEYKSDKKRYGPFLLGNILGVDQVPEIGPKRLHIRNKRQHRRTPHQASEKNIEKRQILPSTLEGMRLSKAIQEIKTCHKGLKTPEKKVDAVTQRKNASLEKKLNSEDLPQGWSKENF